MGLDQRRGPHFIFILDSGRSLRNLAILTLYFEMIREQPCILKQQQVTTQLSISGPLR